MRREKAMENKADMPNWNRFVEEVLSSRNKGSESKHENSLQCGQNEIPSKAKSRTGQKNTM